MPVPSQWKRTTLGELYEIGSSRRVLKKQWTKSGVPFYRAREIVRLARFGEVENDLFIAEDHFEELRSKHGVPQAGDLMVSAVGTLGACYVVQPNDRFYFKDASVLWFQPKQAIDPRFMQYAFLWDGLLQRVKASDGATVGTFTISRARATKLDIPPFDEQKQIVAVLDQAFAALDRARAHAEANLADARELFETSLEVKLRTALGRAAKRLSDLIEISHGFAFKSKDFTQDENDQLPIVLTPGNYTEDGTLYFRPGKTKRLIGPVPAAFRFQPGDLTIVMTDLSSQMKILGKPAFVESEGLLHNQRIGRIHIRSSELLDRFLYYFLRSQSFSEKIKATATGTMVRHTAPKRILSCQIPLLSLEGQKRVIEALDAIEQSCKQLRSRFERSQRDLATVRQALLNKAFSGQLI